ncbi:hypothetical protein BGZ83_001052 [Gryganskiella cystojenkinii]|nr:hypothetical protein BGZ83_001052 [Gryganskiella cystojenkinii]
MKTFLFGVIKYSFKNLAGKAPKTLPYKNGAFIAFLNASIDRASLQLARNFTVKGTRGVLTRAGLGTDAEFAKHATFVGGQDQGWRGLWIPFKNEVKDKDSDVDATMFHPGEGSDLIILHAHGGGFIDGNAPISALQAYFSEQVNDMA